ncbi:MAG: hypothetical protein AAGD25_17450 [Cyanobacteria bacterium P01_F01_bin.150]
MPCLTLDLATSASLLGTEPESLLEYIHRKDLPGVLFFTEQPKVSVFTLANLLNTTPASLMEVLEDEALAELMEEADDDEWFEGDDARKAYDALIAKDIDSK